VHRVDCFSPVICSAKRRVLAASEARHRDRRIAPTRGVLACPASSMESYGYRLSILVYANKDECASNQPQRNECVETVSEGWVFEERLLRAMRVW
jgi:hypothetical protein